MLSDIKLVEFLCAKFSHDLAGPVGAVSNGVDFLRETDPVMREKAIKLVEKSSYQLVNRLKLFRFTHGASPKAGEANMSEIKNLLDEYLKETKVSLDWPIEHIYLIDFSISFSLAKILSLIILTCTQYTLSKGVISVRINKESNEYVIEIKIISSNIKIEELKLIETDSYFENEEIHSSKNIISYYIKRLINENSYNFFCEEIEGGYLIKLQKK